MAFVFGQSFTARVYPLVDDDAFTPGMTAANLVSAYLFDAQPTRAAAASGTGALPVTIAGWTWDATNGAFAVSVPALNDPEPTAADPDRTYFLAVNWRLEAGQQVQTTVQPLVLMRLRSQGAGLYVTAADLEDYYPDITAYGTPAQLAATIAQASDDVRGKLQALGYRWAGVTRPDRLKQVVVLRVLSIVMLAQVQASGDKFYGKFTEYRAMYLEALDGLKVEYDLSGDGVPDAEPVGTQPAVQSLWVVR